MYEEHKKSALYLEFCNLASNTRAALESIDTDEHPNELFSPSYLVSFIEKHIPFVPLFTPLMLKIRGLGNVRRQSNALVESYFGIVKNYLHVTCQPDKCSRYFKKTRDWIVTEHKAVVEKIPSVQCNRPTKKSLRKINSKECWDKKKKPRYCKTTRFETLVKEPPLYSATGHSILKMFCLYHHLGKKNLTLLHDHHQNLNKVMMQWKKKVLLQTIQLWKIQA